MNNLMLLLITAMMIGAPQRPDDRPEVSADREFTLPLGGEATLESTELVIGFISVIEDSRCPEGVDCIWSGNAKIEIELSQPGAESVTLPLNTHVQPQSTSYSSHRITLLALNPYPKSGETIQREKYEARLIISRE